MRELSYLLKDSGAKVLLALESLYDEVGRQVVPETDVELVLTTSEHASTRAAPCSSTDRCPRLGSASTEVAEGADARPPT